ncbi:unnamed protein product [Arctia plantaginis]|uniref:Uncharacterized protein n=1 Tax=Arctia plantaginis TaxID=874455 RepID=A0A8S1B2M5_ARCPL|nr:unnamed protein product [Arctia plantaginis]
MGMDRPSEGTQKTGIPRERSPNVVSQDKLGDEQWQMKRGTSARSGVKLSTKLRTNRDEDLLRTPSAPA